jgi:hypothetical protein
MTISILVIDAAADVAELFRQWFWCCKIAAEPCRRISP